MVALVQRVVLRIGFSALVLAGLSIPACMRGNRENQETDPQRVRVAESVSAEPPAAAPATPSAPAGAPSSGHETIVVSIDALPSQAKIFLDGVLLPSNPFEAERPRDARSHVIRVEAPGYVAQSASVSFADGVQSHVELVSHGGAAVSSAHRPTGTQPPPTATP